MNLALETAETGAGAVSGIDIIGSILPVMLLVLGVPIWRHVDLLAVVSNPEDGTPAAAADADDPTLTRVLEAGSAMSRGADAAARQV